MSSWQLAQVSEPIISAGSGVPAFLCGLVCCLSAPAALTCTASQKQNSDTRSATQKSIRLICHSRKEVKQSFSLPVSVGLLRANLRTLGKSRECSVICL